MGWFKVEWQGSLPEECSVCKNTDLDRFVDGTGKNGHWSIFCPECYQTHGIGEYGVGLGQMYDAKTRALLAGAPQMMQEGD